MTLFYTSQQQQQQQQNHNIHSGNLNNITQRTSPTTTTTTATSASTLNMSSSAAGEATSVAAVTTTITTTTPTTTNLVADSTVPTTTDLPDIIAPFPKKFLYAYAGHLLNNGNNNNFISTQVAPTVTNASNNNDSPPLTTSSLLQLQLQHQQQHQQLQQQLQQQKLELQQIQQKMTSSPTTNTTTTTAVTNDSPWGLSAVQEDSEDDNLNNNKNNNVNNNGDTLESMSDEALACAELMEIMGNSSRGSSRPVSLSGSPDRFSNSIINGSNISNINKKFLMKNTTKSMEELKINDNKNNITNDFYDDNDRNESTTITNISNSYDESKVIEIEKMRPRPFTISTSTLNTSSTSSSASGSTTTTIRQSRLAVDNSHLLFGSSPITRAHNPLPMDSHFSPTKQRSKQFPHNHNQQQLLRPTSLYQTNNRYYYDDRNNSGIEGETNIYDDNINNENAASDITTSSKIGGISRMINNLNDNSFETVSKIPHNLSKASKTAIFMSISEGGRRRSLSVGSAGLKTGSKIIGC